MKKRLIISSYDDVKNPFYAGGGAYTIHKSALQLKKNFDVTVLTGKFRGSKDQTIEGIFYKRTGIPFGGPKLGQIAYQLTLPFLVRKENYDLWVENFTPPFSTSFLPIFTKKPVVGLVHMLSAKDMERKYKLPFHIVEDYGLKKYKKFIVMQNQTKNEILQKNKDAKVFVIPNGVDPIKIPSNVAKKHILFLGRIEVDQKGLDLLLQAYKLSNVPQKLVIAGGGEAKQLRILSNLIKELKLTNKVKLEGRVDSVKKARLLAGAYCVVVPSRFETFCMVCLESLSAGIPLITFNINGLKWMPNGLSVKIRPYDTVKLASAISDLISNNKSQRTISKKGISYTKKFNWNFVGQEYLKVLSS